MKKVFRDFVDFIQTQGVVGVAIAFVMGAAVTKLVTAFVTSFINPLLSILLGSGNNLASATFTIGGAKFPYGLFISALIDFFVIAFVVYFFFKYLKFEQFDKKSTEEKDK